MVIAALVSQRFSLLLHFKQAEYFAPLELPPCLRCFRVLDISYAKNESRSINM